MTPLHVFLSSLSLTLTIQAFHKLDVIATQHTEKLRKLTKQVQEYRKDHDDEAVKRCVEEYDDTLEKWAHFNSNPHMLFPVMSTV